MRKLRVLALIHLGRPQQRRILVYVLPPIEADVREGDVFRLSEGHGTAKKGEVLFEFTGFLQAVHPGHRVVLADGQTTALNVKIDGSGGSKWMAPTGE